MEFVKWPSTPRLFREVIITEKIDGTNACIVFEPAEDISDTEPSTNLIMAEDLNLYRIGVQSRKRLISPEDDNFGFAKWVYDNAVQLFTILGPGRHYGEWWGKGIQRSYGSGWREFSLFNTKKLDAHHSVGDAVVNTVPVLYQGPFSEVAIDQVLKDLKEHGSYAYPYFDNPEGICVFHTQSRQVYKVTLDHNDAHKWEVYKDGTK